MFLQLLAVLSWCVYAQVPDATTQVSCTGTLRVVSINSILGVQCTVQGMAAGSPVSVPFTDFGFAVSESNGGTTNMNPPNGSATMFSFQIQVLGKTGPFSLNNAVGAPVINFTVITSPGPLTELKCPSRQRVNETCNCTVIPRDATGAAVWVEASKFSFSGLDKNNRAMVWGPPSSALGNNFLIQATFPVSSVFTVTNGFSLPVLVAALDDPDTTSVVTCVPDVVPVSTITVCSLEPRKNSKSVTVLQSMFQLQGLNFGTVYSAITPEDQQVAGLGSRFTVTATVGPSNQAKPNANTGIFNFTDAVALPVPVTIIVDPDQTSVLTCSSNEVVAGGVLSCISTPRLVGVNVYCQTSLWQLSVDDKAGGSGDAVAKFSAISPATAGNSFHWTVTPNVNLLGTGVASAEIIINDGKSPQFVINVTAPITPDSTSMISCSSIVVRPAQPVQCNIFPKAGNVAVASRASAFNMSDAKGGAFSMIIPQAGKILNFTYTPKATTSGTVTLTNGVGSKLVITVSGTAPTTAVPTSPTSPTTPTTTRAPTPVARKPEEEGSGGGIGAGGIVGILLTLMVLGGGVGFFLYKRKKAAANKVMPLEANNYAPPTLI